VVDGSSESVEEIRERIVAAAAESFMKYGYAAASLNHISGLLNATKGMIYHHYNSKAELLFAVHQKTMDINLGAMRPIARRAAPAGERLKAMLEEQIFQIMEHFPFMCVARQGVEMYLLDSIGDAERALLLKLVARRREFELLFLRVVEEGIESGEFRKVDAVMANRSLLGALNWLTVWYKPRKNETAESRKKIIDGVVDFIMGSLKRI
jgi:AcrR family transcriptional regulator